jgi:hypothetical protein
LRDLAHHLGLFTDRVEHQRQHRHVLEHAASELDARLQMLTSRRTVDEARQTAEEAETVPAAA